MKTKKVKLKVTQKHPKGDIPAGSIYHWDENLNTYVYKDENNIAVSSVNIAGVNHFSDLFERI